MKKIILLLAGATILSFFSCTKTLTPTDSAVQVQISVDDISQATKAIKTSWTDGDKINIWFGDAYWNVLPQLVLTYSSGAWSASTVDEALLSATGTFTAVFEASNSLFNSPIDSKYVYFPKGAEFQTASMSGTARPRTPYLSCSKVGVAYTYDSVTKILSATISSWDVHTQLQVVVSGLTGSPDKYALGCPELICANSLYYTDKDTPIEPMDSSRIGDRTSPNGWCGGVANADGVAFNFRAAVHSTTETDYYLYLYDTETKKMYRYVRSGVTLNLGYNMTKGIKIESSRFGEITP